jgi:hypothetical protein
MWSGEKVKLGWFLSYLVRNHTSARPGNPKPRSIEKDIKIFPWVSLGQALKIISKYVSGLCLTRLVEHKLIHLASLRAMRRPPA